MLGLQRIAFVLATVGTLAWQGHRHAAWAKDKHAESDDEEEDDGDDKGDKGGSDSEEEEETDEDDKDQPKVTAGGNFTIKNYPVSELERPLTITEHVTQLRISAGTDLSAKGAFSTGGLSAEGEYGVKDNFTVMGGVVDAYNFKQFSFYAGFEGAIAYDMFDVRVAANVHRTAIAHFCAEDMTSDACNGADPTLPSGQYSAGGTQFSIDVGFPIRYAFTPQIAVVAFPTLFSIDFNTASSGDPNGRPMGAPLYCTGVGTDSTGNPIAADPQHCLENGAKPDFIPSAGVATNPIPQLSVVLFGQLRIPDFDTSKGNFEVPLTARVQFSPTQKIDIGAEFTLLNVTPPAPQSPADNRFLSLYVQARI